MTTISDTAAAADVALAPKAKTRNPSLDRARTFLTLIVLLHHAVIPYTYYGHTDPMSFFGFDMIVLATDSFFMAMFFFLSGLFVWPGIARKGPLNYLSDRLLRLGLPFVICAFTVIPLAYYSFSLRHHPEIGFSEFWWKMITVGPVAERADLVPLGVARLRRGCLHPVSAVAQHARSDQPPLAARSPPAGSVLRGHACRHRRVLHPRADSLRSRQLVRVRAVLGPARARDALRHLLLFRRRHRRRVFGSRAVGGGRPDGEGQLGLDDPDDRSVLPDVGADLHQARHPGESGGLAGLV